MTSREDRATITAIIGVSSLLSGSESPGPSDGSPEVTMVSGEVTAIVIFPTVVPVFTSSEAVCAAEDVVLGGLEVDPGADTAVLMVWVSLLIKLTVVFRGSFGACVVVGPGAMVGTVAGELTFRLSGLVPFLPSGSDVGAFMECVAEVCSVDGGTEVTMCPPRHVRPLPSKRTKNHESMLTLIIVSTSSIRKSLGSHTGSSKCVPVHMKCWKAILNLCVKSVCEVQSQANFKEASPQSFLPRGRCVASRE